MRSAHSRSILTYGSRAEMKIGGSEFDIEHNQNESWELQTKVESQNGKHDNTSFNLV